jgi:hypothetical protein
MWFGVTLMMDTQNTVCFKEIGMHAHNMITILDSIINIISGRWDRLGYLMSTITLTLIMIKIYT